MLISNSTLSLLLPIAIIVSLAHWLFTRFFWRHAIPSTIPWAGVNNGSSFSRARATLRSLLDTRGLLVESYTKVRPTIVSFKS